MASALIDDARVAVLNDRAPQAGDYVLYWMQASVRTRDNHALEYAARLANDLEKPLVVCFGIDPAYPSAQPHTMRFLLDGLGDIAGALERRRIGFVVRRGRPPAVAVDMADDAAAVVTDRGYLRGPRRWRRQLASRLGVPVVEVESNVVVPVEAASDRREWAARTIRPRLDDQLERHLTELTTTAVERKRPPGLGGLDVADREGTMSELGLDPTRRRFFAGGEHQAYAALRRFVADALAGYSDAGTSVTGDASSHLSMYLHFGHISPVAVVNAVRNSSAPPDSVDAFIEEVVVRRELAHNYVWFEPDYDRFRALPDWARRTLADHRDDVRDTVYSKTELEAAETHDRYWNAAMIEMRETGYLHNRMRMYWGKRILEWTNTPEYAFRVALELNNRYFLDGRDPNSYANVAWLFGLHDQAFAERSVIGKTRPMTQAGLARKIDADAYVAYVEEVTGRRVGE